MPPKVKSTKTEVKTQTRGKGTKTKGTARKPHTKVRRELEDNIKKITRPALLRILRKSGVKRVSRESYNVLRDRLVEFLQPLVEKAVIFMAHEGRKTISMADLRSSLNANHISLAAGLDAKSANLQSCNARGKKRTKTTKTEEGESHTSKGSSGKVEQVKTKKPHRFRPGTVALKDIKIQQKNSDRLAIPKLNFETLVREFADPCVRIHLEDVVENAADVNSRFENGVCDLLQLVVENFLYNLCRGANLCALHCSRQTVLVKDFELAIAIRDIMAS
jgi:histone H3/H4